ncbi:UDP-N-acetylmuramoyl-L-alanyl-D-glutamate--2,6-diaminopimelate ligase, partial [candidate division WOR-3 bacterium]|nr:UDP-N-acetylmuramoyl-L-alanyl-D-glutamate--2,6-diaminopimelate ligase [candidate division WOR-3 bacterium]
LEVKGIACHSAAVKPGYLFVAIDGFRTSGAEYIDDAVNRGATAVATSDLRRVRRNWIVGIQTQFPRRFLAQVANRYYDFPGRKLTLVGVTGTNGKTTTTYLLRSIARQMGIEPGFVGTIEHWDGQERRRATQTTPESLDFVQLLGRLVEKKVPLCVAEVSSHSLELDRVFDLDFRVAVFTNLTQDHLDFHRTFDAYRAAKMKLFETLTPASHAVVNYDERMGRDIPHLTRGRVLGYGLRSDLEPVPDVAGEVTGVRGDGLDGTISSEGRTWPVRLKLVGRYNLYNALAAFAAGRALGWDPEAMVAGLQALDAVPGRLEAVRNEAGRQVFVDYAHTPDALTRVLKTAREFTTGRVICVFGCGGDRDRAKRPLMGQAVAELADLAVVTSDNPRSEDPLAIIAEIQKGMGTKERVVEPDRREAIARALAAAGAGDTVLVCGKGHEDYQQVGTERRHFDDREVVAGLLAGAG